MKQLILKPLYHNQEENIALFFPDIPELNKAVRKLKGARWTRTHNCWYLPLGKQQYNEMVLAFKGLVIIEQSALYQYLAGKKKKEGGAKSTGQHAVEKRSPLPQKKRIAGSKTNSDIHPVNAHVLPALQQHLILKSYSASTIKTYTNEVGVFLRTIQAHEADTFATSRIKDYLHYCLATLGLSENTLHSRINGLKFYYEQVLKREKLFWDIPRPKKAVQLPSVLSKEEMIRLLKAIENIKHKTMIMLGYACGLRGK